MISAIEPQSCVKNWLSSRCKDTEEVDELGRAKQWIGDLCTVADALLESLKVSTEPELMSEVSGFAVVTAKKKRNQELK